ncbi:MAG: hypothetical protein E3J72_10280 [Planctomycetota bacterium]|nr:MAG: hypothetical protein E3J72_10280 [Planctomycetota bacterium]
MKSENCFLMLLKDQDKYLFKYAPGNEKNLFFALLEMGRSEEYNISLVEVFHLIRKISNHLQKHGVGKSMTFEWPLTAAEE